MKKLLPSRTFHRVSGVQASVPGIAIVNFVDACIYILGVAPGALRELTHFIPTTAI